MAKKTIETDNKITDFISFIRELEKHQFVIESRDTDSASAFPKTDIADVCTHDTNTCVVTLKNGYHFVVNYEKDTAFCD